MHTTSLRKVGGSVMLAVPPALLVLLDLHAGENVEVDVDNGRLVIQPHAKPSYTYTMAELLSSSDYNLPQAPEDREWLDAPATGRELL